MAVMLLLVPQILDGLFNLAAQRQGVVLPPGVIELIEQAERLPPLLSFHPVLQPFMINFVAVPGLAETVAELRSRSLSLLFQWLESDEGFVEIARTELFQCSLAKCVAPLTQP